MTMIRVVTMIGEYMKVTIQIEDVIEVKLNILKSIKSFSNQTFERYESLRVQLIIRQ